METERWRPGSWRLRPALQQAEYPDAVAFQKVLAELALCPPLVTSWEVELLRVQLAEAAVGRRFLLQGGDCAEQFDDCRDAVIKNRLKILLQMSVVLIYGMKKPVVRVGRFAGQYAKPRSSATETRQGVTLPSYRGDIVNAPEFTVNARRPDPARLLKAYHCSAMLLNFVRALADGGFADLHFPENWELDFADKSSHAEAYRQILGTVREALRFAEAVSARPIPGLRRVDFFTSHEALHLHYEEAFTRAVPRRPGHYNLSTHFPWIGKRTAQYTGAHVEYMRGIRNPMGVKVGPGTAPSDIVHLAKHLNPENEPGRITLITRFGAATIERELPAHIAAVEAAGQHVLWCCDPMHGNTEQADNGFKTRRFDNILAELEMAFDIHARVGTILGGVHFELTGENVTECTGGARGLVEADLARAYYTSLDPRLNVEQSLEMALRIVQKCHQMGQ